MFSFPNKKERKTAPKMLWFSQSNEKLKWLSAHHFPLIFSFSFRRKYFGIISVASIFRELCHDIFNPCTMEIIHLAYFGNADTRHVEKFELKNHLQRRFQLAIKTNKLWSFASCVISWIHIQPKVKMSRNNAHKNTTHIYHWLCAGRLGSHIMCSGPAALHLDYRRSDT